jgi:type II secretory pathway predicted ATPase ExeA
MNHKQLLSLYGLKWNPFSPDLPIEGLVASTDIDRYIWRIEQLYREGGFAMITGDPGTGKSATLRLLFHRLSQVRDVAIVSITRPQSKVRDFYHELGSLFGIELKAHNAFGGFAALRKKWKNHAELSLVRPIVIIDEAQDMDPSTLLELRMLSSSEFDSQNLLTVILAGDKRLPEKFRTPELQPIGSRMKVRLVMENLHKEELLDYLSQMMTLAGNPNLMTREVQTTLAEHCMGNFRILMTMAAELLVTAIAKNSPQIDEALYFEVFAQNKGKSKSFNPKR